MLIPGGGVEHAPDVYYPTNTGDISCAILSRTLRPSAGFDPGCCHGEF